MIKVVQILFSYLTDTSSNNAFFIIMGLHIGATFSSFLCALVFVTNKNKIRRAIGAAWMHYVYFTLVVMLLLPLEVLTGE